MKRIVSFLLALLRTLTLCVTAFAAPVGRNAVCSDPNPIKLLSNANIFPYALRKSVVKMDKTEPSEMNSEGSVYFLPSKRLSLS